MPAPVDVTLLNPLPRALAHYEAAALALLRDCGVVASSVETHSAELGRHGPGGRLVGAGRLLHERIAPPGGSARTLVLWPVFGLADPALWRVRRGSHLSVVVHDPRPLRRQVGMSRLSARFAKLKVNRRRPGVITHSAAATRELEAVGWEPEAQIPLPLLAPEQLWNGDDGAALVLGQFKSARDVALMTDLAPQLRARGLRPVVRGRGWPPIAGWEVHEGFLDEDDFDRHLRGATCLLLPYRTFFQSDVAVRAAESGVPVIASAGSSVADLFGKDWPGLVAPSEPASAWADAAVLAGEKSRDDVVATCRSAWHDVRQAWAVYVAELPEATG